MSTAEAKLPWLKFEPQVWLSDPEVRALTPAQRGIYADLISIDWISRGLPENPKDALRLLTGGVKIKDVGPALSLFKVKLTEGRVTHRRSERQRAEFAEKSEANRDAAKARWEGRRKTSGASKATPSESFENGTPAMHPHSERNANASEMHHERTCEKDASGHAKDMPRALARDVRIKKEDINTYTSLNGGGKGASAAGRVRDVNHDWRRREMAALPASWSFPLRKAWLRWLKHLVAKNGAKYPARDASMNRPTESALQAHRRDLRNMADDAARVLSLHTSIGADLARPCEPTARPAARYNNPTGGRAPISTSADHEKGF